MEQFEQLLTCCVCLDRYRNPKLLPCQHSFCMEPCMDGLVDYVRRQVKCPECRAEHRIPYQGVQGFPTNVTLQRFLELHIEISGELPDPTAGQIMERCNVCSEKSYCSICGHCDKKVCGDCKGAHMDILRREIARINNQVRRGIHRLQDILAVVEKNMLSLQTNCSSVSEEVDEIYRRLGKALKDRTEFLRNEIDRYHGTEVRNLSTLKDNLELEIGNISSNCDLADKHMNEDVEWDDTELMDAKEIFLKTVEFIRNFDYEASDYGRRVRFVMAHDPNQLVLHVAGYGELNINTANTGFTTGGTAGTGASLAPPGGPGLMRSKSDHRLATQFRQQEESRYGDRGYGGDAGEEREVLGGRKFGDRRPAPPPVERYGDARSYGVRATGEYGAGDEYGYDNDSSRPRRFKSRFVRSQQGGDDSDTETSGRNVKFNEAEKGKERVFDTEDVARGPLSGIFRLTDSPRVMKRLQESDPSKKKVKEVPPPQPAPLPRVVQKKPPAPAARQVSEDDEIAKIKRQNKGAGPSERAPEAERPPAERVAALKRAPDEDERRRAQEASSEGESDESGGTPQRGQRKPIVTSPAAIAAAATPRAPSLPKRDSPVHKLATRSESSESSTSSESVPAAVPAKNTEPEKKEAPAGSGAQRFQSRFLPPSRPTPPPPEPVKSEETETSSEEETDSSEESEEDEATKKTESQAMAKSDIGPLLARSSNARETAQENKANKDGSPTVSRSSYTKPEEPPASPRYRTRPPPQEEEPPSSRYGTPSTGSGYTSRFLNKSKPASSVEEDDKYSSSRATEAAEDKESKYPTGRSRYLALKERRNRLARSRSSHTGFGGADDDELDDPVSPTTASPSAYLASKYGSSAPGGSDLARSRSSHALKSRETSPDKTASSAGGEKDGASSWARYLKTKYGGRAGKEREGAAGSTGALSPSSSAAARRLSLGLPLRSASEMVSSDDDQKNAAGSPISPTAATAVVAGFAAAGSSPRSQYLQKRRQLFKVGSRGSEPGSFTWPRGIAVGPDNTMVVADSSNHRVQVFDSNGIFVREFGTYGSAEGEFDCLAGVAVNRIGQYIIADRYNHRIQVMDPSGRFLRAFGSQGTGDGRFNCPWGITTDALGFIYVCDKENHRVQVFQSDGTFVGKFGSFGHKAGQLEHPHYIAVSSTNRVIVSDSNNHRVQIFDVNGRVLSAFGTEGSEEGQFKFPRGVAVDDQGYICVADSGNNRIQIFHPDGTFLRAFGSWGSGDAEFKGLEGIAVMSNGNIIVCDRENHRVQVF